MKKLKLIGLTFGLFNCLFLFSGISGCNNETVDIQNWVDNIGALRVTADKEAQRTPYRMEQHKALKAYFLELSNLALAVKKDSGLANRFNGAAAKADLQKVCSKMFFARTDWQYIMRSCKKNRFFLCSEEVRAYPRMVSTLRSSLDAERQKKFDQTRACNDAL